MYPLKFEKVFKKKIWGGQKFATELDIALPDGDKYGESWELCSRASGVSRIMNGPLKGKTLEDVYQEYGSELVGEEVYSEFPDKFPLLVKYLDIEGLLSIRVHPDDKYAMKHEKDYGKSKSWYILDASPDAKVIMGLADGVGREEFLRRAADKDFEGLFRIIPVLILSRERFIPAMRARCWSARFSRTRKQNTGFMITNGIGTAIPKKFIWKKQPRLSGMGKNS